MERWKCERSQGASPGLGAGSMGEEQALDSFQDKEDQVPSQGFRD